MKKVLLINSNFEVLPYPVAPLGLSLVASSIHQDYNVKLFDVAFNSTDSLIEFVNDFDPHYIGIGIRNIDNVTMRKSKWYIRDIREKIIQPLKQNTSVPIIIGGSGFSIAPVQMMEFFDVDYGVYGEAEQSFPALLKKLDSGIRKFYMKGVIGRGEKEISCKNYQKQELKISKSNIDLFIDFSPYKTKGSYPVQSKRGCSHKCIYCSYPFIEGNKYRLRPVAEIVDEIVEVSNRIPGITIEFVDSTFNSPLNHAIAICKEIVDRKLNIKLRTMGVNPGEVTKELIVLMKQAGFSQIDCTPDSASEVMLKNYRKNFRKEKLIECADILKELQMPTMWFFMMGAPGETPETIKETFVFIDEHVHSEDMVHITEGIRIIPNTELYTIAISQGVITENDYVISPMYYVDPALGKDNLSAILQKEIAKRNNVLNSIDTAPSKELMQAAIQYRAKNGIDEPMFRTLLRLQNNFIDIK